jgi:hypothetical protein
MNALCHVMKFDLKIHVETIGVKDGKKNQNFPNYHRIKVE